MSVIALHLTKKFAASSARVKCVDIHPTEPWILSSLYNGAVHIYDYRVHTTLKTIEVSQTPVRAVKFIARKQWIVTAADDFYIRIYNINTLECIKKWVAHQQFIRCIAVHSTQPVFLTCSDDTTIKLWNWESNFDLVRTFEGHRMYVMYIVFNPKDMNTFASASLDGTIRVWNLGSSNANFTLEGHSEGVNCVDYYHGGDMPYLVSGSDDRTVKIWDYQTKMCVTTLANHSDNVTSVAFHPELPIIISGSEDENLRIWNSSTYRIEVQKNYGLERLWCICCAKGTNGIVIGYDLGTIFLRLSKEMPCATMDFTGKVLVSYHNSLVGYNLGHVLKTQKVSDGDLVTVPSKELGTCEFYPQSIKHSPNGRFVAVTGMGDYIVYTALTVRSQKFGNALEFVWDKFGGFAIHEESSKISIFDKKFDPVRQFRPDYSVDGIFGGVLLGVRSAQSLYLYDWISCQLIRKIDVFAKQLTWSEAGDLLVLVSDSNFFLLAYNSGKVSELLSRGPLPSDSIEDSLEVLGDIPEKVKSSCWVGDCFIYVNSFNVLKYTVGIKGDTIAHLDHTMYLLGYLTDTGKIVLIDKSLHIVTYSLELDLVNFQTAVLRQDMDTARKFLKKLPESEMGKVSRFLTANGHLEWALEVSPDPSQKFDLALQLGKLSLAYEIATQSDSEGKWRELSRHALMDLNIPLAEECMWKYQDFASLLNLYVALGNTEGLNKLAVASSAHGCFNINFISCFLLNKLDDCLNPLTDRKYAEALMFARAYLPSKVDGLMPFWKQNLQSYYPRQAQKLACPEKYPNLFPERAQSLEKEKIRRAQPDLTKLDSRNFIYILKGEKIPDREFKNLDSNKESTDGPTHLHQCKSTNNLEIRKESLSPEITEISLPTSNNTENFSTSNNTENFSTLNNTEIFSTNNTEKLSTLSPISNKFQKHENSESFSNQRIHQGDLNDHNHASNSASPARIQQGEIISEFPLNENDKFSKNISKSSEDDENQELENLSIGIGNEG